jgi:acetylornithine deacetylase/succinyl-diaminopimelate desuccinylase-like protein
MTEHLNAALTYVRQHKPEFLTGLKEIVAIPSVSTDPEAAPAMQETAEWVASRLKTLGIENVAVMPTEKHPVVYGEWMGAPGKPVVLIYGHYDVQPVDPIELWHSAPFEPTEKGENLYGRGASDMKGQVLASLYAVEAIVRTGKMPVNLKFMIEGEEEIGSPSLGKWMREHKELLKADFCLNPDSGMIGEQFPTITYGLRGLAGFELRIYGPDHDLHSGIYGGTVHNPAVALAELIAGMHTSDGFITLPGFFDDAFPVSAEERANLARLPIQDDFFLKQTGAPALWGEPGFTSAERVSIRPTLEVNGMTSGFTGAGFKTVLPAYAMAKISCRLVPGQDPKKISASLRQYLAEKAPKTIRWELIDMQSGPAALADINQPGVKALERALEAVWGTRPLYKREGGSIPVVVDMQTILGIESVLTGFGLPDDNLHAPNEKIHLPTWYKGIEAFVHFFFNL